MPDAAKPSRSVLVVDDDFDYSQLLLEAFAEAGFRTLLANNGDAALQVLRKQPVDLVVSDFIMPEMNGLELCRQLEQDAGVSSAKVILYSCNTDAAFRRRARELGAVEYLAKSDNVTDLVRQVCELAGLSAPDRAPESAGTGPGADAADGVHQHLQSVSIHAAQIRTQFDSLWGFVQILALGEQLSPATRLAWEAAQRSGADIKRLLGELEVALEQGPR